MTAGIEPPRRDCVTVAADQACAAGIAIGALPRLISDVAGVHVAETSRGRDVAGPHEGRCRRCRDITHPPIGVKRGEVKWDVLPELLRHPFAQCANLARRVIFSRNEQRGDLKPGVGFMLNEENRI